MSIADLQQELISLYYQFYGKEISVENIANLDEQALQEVISDLKQRIAARTVVSPTRESPCAEQGDVDGDGWVTSHDAWLVGQYVAKTAIGLALTKEQVARGCVRLESQATGKPTVIDAMFIGQYAEGLINTFPTCTYFKLVNGEYVYTAPPTPSKLVGWSIGLIILLIFLFKRKRKRMAIR